MAFVAHGDQKYRNSEKLAAADDWPGLSIEHRKFAAGCQATPIPFCTELVMLLSGGGIVCRTGNGEIQKSLARRGMSYLVPIGTQESHVELSDWPVSAPIISAGCFAKRSDCHRTDT
ncbi:MULTISPECIES: hypothetical protein [unclassified Bradyrhizobium]|uniref:hypothetical protein n=1 Tax=unclassified Bradyrhizobium TaxID=2631580 RepID=UPI002916F996|nr:MULTISPECIES: hypothetical protein [unclassified Bradyrhizobium]